MRYETRRKILEQSKRSSKRSACIRTGSDGFGTFSTEQGTWTRGWCTVRVTGGGEDSTLVGTSRIGVVHVNERLGRMVRQPTGGNAGVVVARVPIVGAS